MERDFYPNSLLIHNEVKNSKLAKLVSSNLKKLNPASEISYIDSDLDPFAGNSDKRGITAGKETLLLKKHKGLWLKSCPGTKDHVCCNLWIINLGEGCPLDCSYCYLQDYLSRNPTLKLYTNTDDALNEIEERSSADLNRLFRVTTGEVIDSLVWDELSGLSRELVPFFANKSNLILELKTKTNLIDNLIDMEDAHNGKTVVSWSVGAESISSKEELKTASLDERIDAAVKVSQAGYRVGFHFDPMIYFDGWKSEYLATAKKILSNIEHEKIAWISISSLRFTPALKDMASQRFPDSSIFYGNRITTSDSKIRYLQPIRLKMINTLWSYFKSENENIPVYMCMENSTAWKSIAGHAPAAGSELKEVFARQYKSRNSLKVVS